MRAVHSFWFAPFFHTQGTRVGGGFLEPRFFGYSWALSFFTVYKKYPHVALVTDDRGCELARKIGLPYHSISNELQKIASFRREFWNLGKFHAYLLQAEPFLHLDLDVYIWKHLPAAFETSRMFGQSYETTAFNKKFYATQLDAMRKHLKILPPEFNTIDALWTNFRALNCGIFGGTDIALIHRYANMCIEIITCPENESGWAAIAKESAGLLSLFNCGTTIEQVPNVMMAEREGFEPPVLFHGDPADLDKNGQLGYTHLFADAKMKPQYLKVLEQRMERDHLKVKEHIDLEFGRLEPTG